MCEVIISVDHNCVDGRAFAPCFLRRQLVANTMGSNLSRLRNFLIIRVESLFAADFAKPTKQWILDLSYINHHLVYAGHKSLHVRVFVCVLTTFLGTKLFILTVTLIKSVEPEEKYQRYIEH